MSRGFGSGCQGWDCEGPGHSDIVGAGDDSLPMEVCKLGSAVGLFSSDEACVFGGVQGGCGPPGDGRGLLDCGGEVSGGGSAESAEVACSIGSLV